MGAESYDSLAPPLEETILPPAMNEPEGVVQVTARHRKAYVPPVPER
jgi:hypothetical protein